MHFLKSGYKISFEVLIVIFIYLFLLIPIILSLEEFFHSAICIQKSKGRCFISLAITTFSWRQFPLTIFLSAAIKAKWKFNPIDKIHIHGGAPSFLLLVLFAIGTILSILPLSINMRKLVFYFLPLLILPVISLIPHKIIFPSDGFVILNLSRKINLTIWGLMRELLYSPCSFVNYLKNIQYKY